MIDAHDVHVMLGRRVVLAGADLQLGRGEVMLLAGRNGSGKSTLLSVLAGARSPDRGAVHVDGVAIASLPPRERARRVATVPQDTDSPFEFTGRELVAMGRHPHVPRLKSLSAHDHAVIDGALQRVDAAEFADRPVTTLSGGERQRIAVARALATEAPVVLADEPTANLDLDHALALLSLLRQHAAAGGAVLLVSHDLNTAAPFADRVALLHEARIACVDEPERALSGARVEQVFGVRCDAPSGYFPRRFRLP